MVKKSKTKKQDAAVNTASADTSTTEETSSDVKVIEAGTNESQVGKQPEEPEAELNIVGQRAIKSSDEWEAYVAPNGKQMIVYGEEGEGVFAGEYGRNAEWFPKEVLDTWTPAVGQGTPPPSSPPSEDDFSSEEVAKSENKW